MPPGGCCTEGVPAPTARACCLTPQVVQPGLPRARTQRPRGAEAPGCSWWNPAGMPPKPTSGRGVNGSAPPKPSLGSTAAGRAVPKRGVPRPSPPAELLPDPRRTGTREGGHEPSAGPRRRRCDSWARFSHVLLQLQPDVIF